MISVSMKLNGRQTADSVEDRELLVDFLRERKGLTGTRVGCDHGACGACTVLLDGIPVRSCVTLAAMCDGRGVETIEGLQGDDDLSVLQRHFHQEHALQCGFCTSGMLIMARDILARHPAADEATIRAELSGQICRCTGYAGIVSAIRVAGKEIASRDQKEPSQATE